MTFYWISLLGIFLGFGQTSEDHEGRLDRLFRSRSNEDWVNLWHAEVHQRCQYNLAKHLYWACEKDIYKVAPKRIDKQIPLKSIKDTLSFLRFRRLEGGGSITNECCYGGGCTWEEYAEYCPNNRRL